ncbi:cytochrome c(L), periplasmic [Aquincola sp. MAHUQ-54]|uniref:Cytochrome c(L), periplasmic n=1 Tax=Aquincola agrisoli TaxID=3119538 RepID=A0AAW9Q253_9BURK
MIRRIVRALPVVIGLALYSAHGAAQAPRFYNLIEGTPLDFNGLKETETEQVKAFKGNGKNPYAGNDAAIKKGENLYATACSGCHGHHAEGKLGPGLNDDYWTYKQAATDAGLFSAIYGGLSGSMGPQRNRMTQDEILLVMAWLRSINKGGSPTASAAQPAKAR